MHSLSHLSDYPLKTNHKVNFCFFLLFPSLGVNSSVDLVVVIRSCDSAVLSRIVTAAC